MRWALALFASVLSVSAASLPPAEEQDLDARGHNHTKSENCPSEGFLIASLGHHDESNWTSVADWGYLQHLSKGIMKQYPDMLPREIHYPRASTDLPTAVAIGVDHLTGRIQEYVDRCPDTPIILLGYSEGAFITMNTLCGTDTPKYTTTPGLEHKYAKNILAAIVWADIGQIAGQPYDMGTCQTNGTRARLDPQACMKYAGRIQSYCDTNDMYCCDPGNSLAVHHSYAGLYTNSSLDFVLTTYASDMAAGKWKQR